MSFANYTYNEKLALLGNEDFLDHCATNDEDPRLVLGVDSASRADKCISPVILERVNLDTGEVTNLTIPCGSSNADKCPECAEFLQRLRNRQILDTLDRSGVRTALLTLTAPSFGAVHRAYWTAKDVFKFRALSDKQIEAKRLFKKSHSRPCPCGGYHTHDEGLIGTPVRSLREAEAIQTELSTFDNAEAPNRDYVATYDYAGEVIWSHNLPALMNSAYKKLKKLAEKHGVIVKGEDGKIVVNGLRLYAVYERQKRGSLHAHILLAVEKNSSGFYRLIADLKENWESPTAVIPEPLVAHYRSLTALGRVSASGVPVARSVAESVPVARWKGGELKPATMFGRVYDVRVLEADKENQDLSTEVKTYKQASSYLSKYLTKNQASFAREALAKMPAPLRVHMANLRKTAIALLADVVVYETKLKTLYKQRDMLFSLRDDDANTFTQADEAEHLNLGLNLIMKASILQRQEGITRSALVDSLLTDVETDFENRTLTRSHIADHLELIREAVEERADDLLKESVLEAVSPDGDWASATSDDETLVKRIINFVRGREELHPHPARGLDRQRLEFIAFNVSPELKEYFSPPNHRSLKIRLNKIANNAGFTGSLTRVSNWGKSLKDLKEEMKTYMSLLHPSTVEYEYSPPDIEAMRAEQRIRTRHLLPVPQAT